MTRTSVIKYQLKYKKLLTSLREEIKVGKERAEKAFREEKIRTYWKVGKTICKHLKTNHRQVNYGKELFKKLSKDLDIGEKVLYQTTQFYQAYPKLTPSSNLNWSHYRLLTSVKDNDQRKELEIRILKNNLSKRNLETLVKQESIQTRGNVSKLPPSTKTPAKAKKLRVTKGMLYTYELIKTTFTNNLVVDLGFKIFKDIVKDNISHSFVKTIFNEKNSDYTFKPINATRKHLYTYKAFVHKIIDGDTIWVNIDLGFKTWTKQKIRLRGIDTPEVTSTQGQESHEYVKAILKGLPFVIVKSHGRDKFGRHLMDLYYLKDELNPKKVLDKGVFLNQELLNKGLAEIL